VSNAEVIIKFIKDRLSPEVLADELFYHKCYEPVARSISEGTPLFGLVKRGTLTKGLVFTSGSYLVLRIPKSSQLQLLEPAADIGYENYGYWGFAFTTPLPPEYQGKALDWYRNVKEQNGYYQTFPKGIPLEDFRCLSSKYVIAYAQILGKYINHRGSLGGVWYEEIFPHRISFLPMFPNNHCLTSRLILNTMNRFKENGEAINQRNPKTLFMR